ncbi:hypothetical protein H6G81_04925 [Scytonema hofmannii FACHB-248]|uniref:Uncharacterized protein n=1 Tax=Scytonema hofmannii FACHB-248 TaxID=1842502 RepID=A0ABR8GL10_9CYAN|nr:MULTISPECIES: hypothetical protein [Nostocales]MBD2603892.1 hypothetical protein [Scytonema hofmannii FACHB-248]
MPESTPNFLPSILATILVIIWFLHKGLLIGFDKKYKKLLFKVTLWLNKRPIILPTILMLISPFLFTYLALPQFELTGLFKQIFSIFTFMLGVIVTRLKEEKLSKGNKKIAVIAAANEHHFNIEILKSNLKIIENNSKQPLKLLKTESLKLINDNIPQEDVRKFTARTRAIRELMDDFDNFNALIKARNSQKGLDERKALVPVISNLLTKLPDLLSPLLLTIVE